MSIINAVRQVYRSGGIVVLLYRIVAFLWKQCAWLYIRVTNPAGIFSRRIYGNVMYLNTSDTGISQELAVYKVHEPVTTHLFRKVLKPGMRVVDIGANIGYYALQEAELVGQGGGVIAIEPVPDNVRLLKKTIETNGYQNVRVYEVAIGPENSTAKIYLSRRSNLHSLLPHADSGRGYIMVPLRTLDSLLESEARIDYIRMDIEGYEGEAIKGMRGILRKHRPGIYTEIHPPHTGGEPIIGFLEELKGLGYRTTCVVDKAFNYPMVPKKDAIETISLDELTVDKRVTQGQAVLSVFLEATEK